MTQADDRPLIVHIVHRFDFGGLENGLVNIVNHLPQAEGAFRHHILSLTEVSTIAERIKAPNVTVGALGKRPGKDLGAYWRLLKLLRALRPTVVHTRNIGTLDCQLFAWLAGVPRRVHGEHGWDVDDPDGTNQKYQRRRRQFFRLVHAIVPLSQDLERYLLRLDGALAAKITRICNGVDLERFPAPTQNHPPEPPIVFGTVTRFSDIKAPLNTIRAFAALPADRPARLIMVGDGPLLPEAKALAAELGVASSVEFAGAQLDVAPWFERFDVFVLSSLREGISNTILEAMAAGLPVVASAVGGNVELVAEGETGVLVPPADIDALGAALAGYAADPPRVQAEGLAARQRAESHYSLNGMVEAYRALYQAQCDAAPASGR